MKIFISTPMRGLKDEDIKNRMKFIMDTYFPNDELIDTVIDSGSPIKCFAKSIEFMDDADLIVFDSGWEKARGCILEKQIAEKYGKNIRILDNDKVGLVKTDISGNTVADLIASLTQVPLNNTFMICGDESKYSICTDTYHGYSSIDTDEFIDSLINEENKMEELLPKNKIEEIDFRYWKKQYSSWCALEYGDYIKRTIINPITMVRARVKGYKGRMHLYEVEFAGNYFDDKPIRITASHVDDEKFYGTLVSARELPLDNGELIIDGENVVLINKTESIAMQEYRDLINENLKHFDD